MFFSNIDFLAVTVAAVVGMAIGFAWYSQWVFGKIWLKAKGWDNDAARHKSQPKSMIPVYITTFVSTFITAFVIAALFNSLVIISVQGIILTGILLSIGFMVPVKFADYQFAGDSLKLFFINAGYWIVEAVVMSLIIGIFG